MGKNDKYLILITNFEIGKLNINLNIILQNYKNITKPYL